MKNCSKKAKKFLRNYLLSQPIHLAVPRAIETRLYQKYLPLTTPILDLGCGDGFFTKTAFKKLIDVGLEINFQKARTAKKEKIYKKVVLYQGKKLPFPNNAFNSVFSNSVLEHIKNIDQTMPEIARVLKKKGKFIFTTPTEKFASYLLGRLFLGKIYESWHNKKACHFHLDSKKTWVKRLKKHGFKILDFEYYLNNKPAMWFFDLAHFLGVPNLIFKRLFNRWVLFPSLRQIFPWEQIIRKLYSKGKKGKGAYMLFYCQKV
ncbi:class I SAM-dependent methyltransferase [Candidatus Microgenomates bacterium]|nr:class I SAM-dependent methyltransferase [Candidatus Microgenomates bacterium]